MKKALCMIMAMLLLFLLSACSTAPEIAEVETTVIAESTVETTEPVIEPEPEWFSEDVIDEALSYLFLLEGEINVPLAQELLLPLVENGCAEAQYYWGYILESFIWDNYDTPEALYWYELAAEQGYPKAYLAAALNTHCGSQEKADELIESARKLGVFEMSSEELGPDGCGFLSVFYFNHGDYSAAVTSALAAAELGCTAGMNNVGVFYFYGAGVEQDYSASLDWFLKAAELGDIQAMRNYGNTLLWMMEGTDKPGNSDKVQTALKWFQKAANAGDTEAMAQLGYLSGDAQGQFLNEYSTNMNREKKWYEKAANAGSSLAMYRLGCLLRDGYQDYDAAMEWFIKAYTNGYDDAAEQINDLLSKKQGLNGYFENYGELLLVNP